jgi:hypothetical protein
MRKKSSILNKDLLQMRTSMLKNAAVILAFTLLTSCGGTETWIPLAANRPAVTRGDVQFLEYSPQRPHIVIGIITPPAGEYDTEAEAVAIRI